MLNRNQETWPLSRFFKEFIDMCLEVDFLIIFFHHFYSMGSNFSSCFLCTVCILMLIAFELRNSTSASQKFTIGLFIFV